MVTDNIWPDERMNGRTARQHNAFVDTVGRGRHKTDHVTDKVHKYDKINTILAEQ